MLRLPVPQHAGLAGEGLLADVALEGLLPRVGEQVAGQVRALVEGRGAEAAFEGALPHEPAGARASRGRRGEHARADVDGQVAVRAVRAVGARVERPRAAANHRRSSGRPKVLHKALRRRHGYSLLRVHSFNL